MLLIKVLNYRVWQAQHMKASFSVSFLLMQTAQWILLREDTLKLMLTFELESDKKRIHVLKCRLTWFFSLDLILRFEKLNLSPLQTRQNSQEKKNRSSWFIYKFSLHLMSQKGDDQTTMCKWLHQLTKHQPHKNVRFWNSEPQGRCNLEFHK